MIPKRELKCLERLRDGKSLPDWKALIFLQRRKLVTIEPDDDGMKIDITDAGRDALANQQ